MGIVGLFGFAVRCKLYKVVHLKELAEEFRRENGEDPEIAVDGSACAWYLYEPLDFLRGGQYKKFREECANFVQHFHDAGIRLVFFFHGPPVEEEMHLWSEKKKDKVMGVSNLFRSLHLGAVPIDSVGKMLPEAVIPSARVIFKDDLACKVFLSKDNCKHDIAKYISDIKCCLGVLTSDADFFALKGVKSVLTFKNLERADKLKTWQFKTTDIVTHLGIQQEDMPTFASFVGNDFVRPDLLSMAYNTLKKRYGQKSTYHELVVELMKEGNPRDLVNMCKIAFIGRWRDGLAMVEAGIRSYNYQPTRWDKLITYVEEKHMSGEIPGTLLSVMKRRLYRIGEVLEDLSEEKDNSSPPTGLVLRPMRERMYKVLLWESDSALCCVTEYLLTETGKVRTEEVELEKQLPPGMEHPGLQQLWTNDDVPSRWHLFTWLVAPKAEPSTLQQLKPQFLVVPAVALLFLNHEAGVLRRHELVAFCITAVAVADLSGHERAANRIATPDTRAIYLASLFVRCVLHVLDAAATCGLSFPRDVDCLPDSYFDGNVFHNVCVKARDEKNPKSIVSWNHKHEVTFQLLLSLIDHFGRPLHPEEQNPHVSSSKN